MWHWHFEITSACTLKCPRCSRTELPEQLVIDSLDLEFFERNFPPALLKEIHRISLCGYDGDPIYNKQFIEICQYFKQHNPTIELYIVTNGSYKKSEWWRQLAGVLNEHDQIHFSLDGWDHESNSQYRVNSDWTSIMSGVQVLCDQPVRLVWDLIYFDFNYQQKDNIIKQATELGFDAIRFTKSNKFNFYYSSYEKDLEPPAEYISGQGRFESETVKLSQRHIYDNAFKNAVKRYLEMDRSQSIIPLCSIGTKGLFVDSRGYFYPCCWVINKYNTQQYQQWLTPDRNIKQSGLQAVLNNPYWEQFKSEIPANSICQSKCNSAETNTQTIVRW